jgi:site-specific DNA recombinase
MRAAAYARYSSELQSRRSIADQLDLVRSFARGHGLEVVAEFSDAALSGASMAGRPQLMQLLETAANRQFDAVIVESLDRLARNQGDLATIHKRLAFHNVRLFTIDEGGEVPRLVLGIKGAIAEHYLVELAAKTKRGQVGRVKAGRIAGGKCYGYDVVPGDDRGRRIINGREAAVVLRIHHEAAIGMSALQIAASLNREGIPGPRGSQWNASTINGSRQRQNGILSNSIYIGRQTYNRQSFIKDPDTGRRQARPNDPSKWITGEVPELAIVPIDLWAAVQARRRRVNSQPLTKRRRPKRLLSGLLTCGVCGASYIIVTKDHVACSAHRNKRTCANTRTMRMAEIEQRVLTALKSHLMKPDVVAAAVEAYRVERQRLNKERARALGGLERELSEVKRQIDRMTGSIKAGIDPRLFIVDIKNALDTRETLEARIRSAVEPDVAVLLPNAAERYKQKVIDIQGALARGDRAALEAMTLVRGMVLQIRVIPESHSMGLEVIGDLAALLAGERGANERDFVGGCGGRI